MTTTQTITLLTTLFTPPPSCTTSFTWSPSHVNPRPITSASALPSGLLIQNAIASNFDTACFPPSFSGAGQTHSSYQVYSPAICPSGYTTGTSVISNSVTAAECCPSGYTYLSIAGTPDAEVGCTSIFPSGSTTTVPALSTTGFDGAGGVMGSETSVITGPVTMFAQAISIAYHESDLSVLTTGSMASSSDSAVGTTAGGSSTSGKSSATAASMTTSEMTGSGGSMTTTGGTSTLSASVTLSSASNAGSASGGSGGLGDLDLLSVAAKIGLCLGIGVTGLLFVL